MSEAVEKNERFIVVGVDGSEPSLKALRWAAQQARLTGATLRVLTTWEVATGTGWVPTFPVDYDPQAVARQALDEAVTETLGADPDVAVERIVKEGHAAPILLAAAKDADLLVVGSHGHGAFAGMLIGSVSEHLVRHAPCAIVGGHCDQPPRHQVSCHPLASLRPDQPLAARDFPPMAESERIPEADAEPSTAFAALLDRDRK